MQVVARRARSLYDAISRLLESLGDHNSFSDQAVREYGDDDKDVDFNLYDLESRLMTLEQNCKEWLRLRCSKKPPHRPRGTIQYPALQFTITRLHEAIETYGGGELSLWHDTAGKWKGTVPQVLAILHPCLPHVVTANPPYATLRRLLSTVVSNGDGRDDGRPSRPHRFKKP